MVAASRAGQPVSPADEDNLNFVRSGWSQLGSQWSRLGYNFVPLATLDMYLQCSVEVLFLRPIQSGVLINAGDLDPRVKTLLAAFRLPNSFGEVAASPPTPDEHPFFCLLQDSLQIMEIKVTIDVICRSIPTREISGRTTSFSGLPSGSTRQFRTLGHGSSKRRNPMPRRAGQSIPTVSTHPESPDPAATFYCHCQAFSSIRNAEDSRRWSGRLFPFCRSFTVQAHSRRQ